MKQVYVPEHYDVLLGKVTECAAKTPKAALAYLNKNIVDYLKKKIEASAGQEKVFFETSHNLVTSYADGLSGGDITVKELKQLRRDMEQARTSFELARAEKLEREKQKKAKEEGAPRDEPSLEELLKERPGFDHGEGATEVYKKYAKYKKEMPKSIRGKPYLAVRMPIVVIPNGIPDIIKLRRTGLCEDMLFGYPVIKNQVLVGMSDEWLRENYGKKQKDSLRKDGEKNVKFDFETACAEIVKAIRQKTGRQYIPMDGVHGFDSPDIMWVWFANSQDLSRLNGTTGQSTFSVREWTLPFEHTMRKMKGRSK